MDYSLNSLSLTNLYSIHFITVFFTSSFIFVSTLGYLETTVTASSTKHLPASVSVIIMED